ncbi:uncharacterized protein A1O5_13306 [Cladophialophora psammophila CBS 110553]|uniref:Uncharacterized protein n=1 Tax=Cladophialophora psammophila CBS 110553 TaxID=1182543 RepID=W9VDA8_9EURO|nr:uncharacterized protein A1O5_13306 [Cladophialophora psammophila CBS 110553]EXJ53438.1 hypothetical protein A1O5_13306 [Cladophialophora psammophila CBS 110553]
MQKVKIQNAILPGRDPRSRWDVDFEMNTIKCIQPATAAMQGSTSDPSPLLLPPLCHPHIHLDKAYLLTCNSQHHPSQALSDTDGTNHPEYTDLTPQDGSFGEALQFTSLAKRRYTSEDLYLRGAQLLATSLAQGVTSCRAFVELDHVTSHSCIEAGLRLKDCFQGKMKLQLCAFAQDPIFSTDHAEKNRQVLLRALEECADDIEVLGTTPYVEKSAGASLQNIEWAIETAINHSLHLDFHLDYNLDETKKAAIWDVIRLLKELNWNKRAKPGKTIVLGHCTRLTLCSDAEMEELGKEITESKLSIHFVGLPTSDLFMMGRPSAASSAQRSKSADRPRGTLQVLDMIKRFGINSCLSVNNVGNAFTPWGTGDPLALASLGVGIYQAGTDDDANMLFECVSSRARKAIGLDTASALDNDPSVSGQDQQDSHDSTELKEGRRGELLLIKNKEYVSCPGHLGVKISARQQVSVRDVVWDPPQVNLRQVLRCR